MYCKHCGRKYPKGTIYCAYCGATLEEDLMEDIVGTTGSIQNEYNRELKSSSMEKSISVEEQYKNNAYFPKVEERASTGTSSSNPLSMGWYNFLKYFLYIVSAVGIIVAIILPLFLDSSLLDVQSKYRTNDLLSLNFAKNVITILFAYLKAIMAFVAAVSMSKKSKNAPALFYLYFIIRFADAIFSLGFGYAIYDSVGKKYVSASEDVKQLIISSIMIFANIRYFNNRKPYLK